MVREKMGTSRVSSVGVALGSMRAHRPVSSLTRASLVGASLVGASLGLAGCGAATGPGVTAIDAAQAIELALTVPGGESGRASLIVFYGGDELPTEGPVFDERRFVDSMAHTVAVAEVRLEAGVVHASVAVPEEATRLAFHLDRGQGGLDAMLVPTPEIFVGHAVRSARVETTLARPALRAPTAEPCEGERDTLVTVQGAEIAHPGDTGERRLCVHVPPSYAAGEERYPVVFALPGYGGSHATGAAWGSRVVFDALGAELDQEAIVVGVDGRTAEGTTYFESSPAFGDWDRFLTSRVVETIDRRFRTNGHHATIGHSTGGWNALSMALRHPTVFEVAAASSPDAPDLDAWILSPARTVRPEWLQWMRVEAALGGPGQFVSYGAAWSPDPLAERGFRWPVDLATGALDREVYARWQGHSLSARVATAEGLEQARALSGRLAITAGRADEFDLFRPSERFTRALGQRGVDVAFYPTDLGHFGSLEPRFEPLVRFLLTKLHGLD